MLYIVYPNDKYIYTIEIQPTMNIHFYVKHIIFLLKKSLYYPHIVSLSLIIVIFILRHINL